MSGLWKKGIVIACASIVGNRYQQNSLNAGVIFKRALLFVAILLVTGCATSPPTAKFARPTEGHIAIRSVDTSTVVVRATGGIVLADYEKSRITDMVKARIATKKTLLPTSDAPNQYLVDVTITRYEKGSAVARWLLIGLGQMHIDGDVKVYSMPAHEYVETFSVHKTFAWGGVYGGITSIEDVEQGFAEGVAIALTTRDQKKDAGGSGNVAQSTQMRPTPTPEKPDSGDSSPSNSGAPSGEPVSTAEKQIPPQAQPTAQSGEPASLDPRVTVPMFNSAQDVASIQQCDRAIRVLNIEGEHALFFTQCSAGQQHLLHIECDGAHCVPLLPPEA